MNKKIKMKFYNPFKPCIVKINRLYYIKKNRTFWDNKDCFLTPHLDWTDNEIFAQFFSTQQEAEEFWLRYSIRVEKDKEAKRVRFIKTLK